MYHDHIYITYLDLSVSVTCHSKCFFARRLSLFCVIFAQYVLTLALWCCGLPYITLAYVNELGQYCLTQAIFPISWNSYQGEPVEKCLREIFPKLNYFLSWNLYHLHCSFHFIPVSLTVGQNIECTYGYCSGLKCYSNHKMLFWCVHYFMPIINCLISWTSASRPPRGQLWMEQCLTSLKYWPI